MNQNLNEINHDYCPDDDDSFFQYPIGGDHQSLEQNQFCSSLTFLTIEQRLYCQTNPKIFSIINRSLNMAINECQYQFRNQRWNCSLFSQPDLFRKLILRSKNFYFMS